MPKQLRDEPIYLDPNILGFRDDYHIPVVIDLQTNTKLNPYVKIEIG